MLISHLVSHLPMTMKSILIMRCTSARYIYFPWLTIFRCTALSRPAFSFLTVYTQIGCGVWFSKFDAHWKAWSKSRPWSICSSSKGSEDSFPFRHAYTVSPIIFVWICSSHSSSLRDVRDMYGNIRFSWTLVLTPYTPFSASRAPCQTEIWYVLHLLRLSVWSFWYYLTVYSTRHIDVILGLRLVCHSMLLYNCV